MGSRLFTSNLTVAASAFVGSYSVELPTSRLTLGLLARGPSGCDPPKVEVLSQVHPLQFPLQWPFGVYRDSLASALD